MLSVNLYTYLNRDCLIKRTQSNLSGIFTIKVHRVVLIFGNTYLYNINCNILSIFKLH